jgi:two-component system, OmpR family, phosphate regulon sensor histidine kinase PhoR
MVTSRDSGDSNRSDNWFARLKRARAILVVTVIALGVLWLGGAFGIIPVLVTLAAVVAAVIAAGGGEVLPAVRLAGDRPMQRVDDEVIGSVLAGLPDPVVALDRQGGVLAMNAQASVIAPALRRGEPVSAGLRNPEILDAIRRARSSITTQRAEIFNRVPVDRWYEVIVTPIAGAPSEPSGGLMLMAFRDLTPLRRAEEMRADFVANASHELRTPLATLSGFIETLQGPARDDAVARGRFLSIMQAQATRMARLIDDLLSLSRIELNAHLRPGQEVDLVAIIRQVADGLQMLARDRGVDVKVTAPAKPVLVLGDRDELLRVFENLVENALKYASSGKRIDIEVATAEGEKREARVAVRDYGPGIAPEHLPRLTERFYRVDVAESRAQGGTGLGLALVKHILNRHGGRLTIESTMGQGATFTSWLPQANSPSN